MQGEGKFCGKWQVGHVPDIGYIRMVLDSFRPEKVTEVRRSRAHGERLS